MKTLHKNGFVHSEKTIVSKHVTKQLFSVNDVVKRLVPLKSVNDVVRFASYYLRIRGLRIEKIPKSLNP